jgi:hypothetical protein
MNDIRTRHLEVLGSLYVLGDKLHVGAPSRREPSFCLQRSSRIKKRAPSAVPDHFRGMTIKPGLAPGFFIRRPIDAADWCVRARSLVRGDDSAALLMFFGVFSRGATAVSAVPT